MEEINHKHELVGNWSLFEFKEPDKGDVYTHVTFTALGDNVLIPIDEDIVCKRGKFTIEGGHNWETATIQGETYTKTILSMAREALLDALDAFEYDSSEHLNDIIDNVRERPEFKEVVGSKKSEM